MTERQLAALAKHAAIQKQLRITWSGRARLKQKLHDAATEIIDADNEAARIAKVEAA